MANGQAIVGRKAQTPFDFYSTPEWATEALLRSVTFDGPILEPCAGAGRMSRVLEAAGYSVESSDVRTDDVYGIGGSDFLTRIEPCVNVVTNPPYAQAADIAERALMLARGKVALFLKLTWLESQKRRAFFDAFPPARVLVFRSRVQLWPDGAPTPTNGSTVTYAWFVWEPPHIDPPTVGWL